MPLIVAAIGTATYLLVAPPSADLMAQLYRANLAHLGTWLWSPAWFSGHLLPSYSVLSPALGAVLGVRVLGAVAVVFAAAAFARLVAELRPTAGCLPATWFSVAAVAALWTGRITFLLGVAIGVATLLAWARERISLAILGAALTALASPVAGLFLALSAVAWGLADHQRRWVGVAVAASALAPIIVLNVAFGEGGTFPFVPSAFWPALAATALVGLLLPRDHRAIRVGVGLYAVLLVAAFVVPSAVGGNATRLGALFAGPVLAAALVGRRPVALACAAGPLLWWALYPPAADWARARHDRALTPGYHDALIAQVVARSGTHRQPPRIEIVPTANKGEAYYVARRVPIARGWERQVDRKLGALFYADLSEPRNTPEGTVIDEVKYRRWLASRAVRWVALPQRTMIDPASDSEARLLRRPPSWLVPAWRSRDWVLFAVQPSREPLRQRTSAYSTNADGTVETRATPGAQLRLPLRYHRWWTVTAGSACVTADDRFVAATAPRGGRIELRASLTGSSCR